MAIDSQRALVLEDVKAIRYVRSKLGLRYWVVAGPRGARSVVVEAATAATIDQFIRETSADSPRGYVNTGNNFYVPYEIQNRKPLPRRRMD